MWSPKLYNAFKTDQFAPFPDLLKLVTKKPNLKVIDLGCGTGELTSKLAESLPHSNVLGVDSSPEMLQEARTFERKQLQFLQMSIEAAIGQNNRWDLIFSHQAIHWVVNHRMFFPKLITNVARGGQLVLQMAMPDSIFFKKDLDELARSSPFKTAMKGWTWLSPVLGSEDYARILFNNGGTDITAFEKVYPTLIKDADALFDMASSTAMTIYMQHLPKEQRQNFNEEFKKILHKKYPETPVFYPYKRMFLAATF